MKQPEDQKTAELKLQAKRGRPVSGNAKSAAERKRQQRYKAKREAIDAIGKESDASDAAIIDVMLTTKRRAAWLEFGKRNDLTHAPDLMERLEELMLEVVDVNRLLEEKGLLGLAGDTLASIRSAMRDVARLA